MNNSISLFRKIAVAEGISFIVLVFIAMPLKYFGNFPLAVKYAGWLHGLLFILYAASLIMVWGDAKWKIGKVALYFVASLIPFAPFWVDKKLKREEAN